MRMKEITWGRTWDPTFQGFKLLGVTNGTQIGAGIK